MVVRARKLLGSALGLVLAGSLLGGPAATAAEPDTGGSGSADLTSGSTFYDLALAPGAAPAGMPIQVQGYIGNGFSPRAGAAVTIYFDPAGTAPREVVTTVTTSSDGWFAKTVRPRSSGTYEILAEGGGEIVGPNTARFTRRSGSQPARSAVISGTRSGYTAQARVIVQDVVTRVEPQTVYLDAGILTPGYSGNIYAGPYMTNRRAEGRYGVGDFYGSKQEVWRTNYSAVRTYRMSAVHPAGLYNVKYSGPVAVYRDRWDADGDNVLQTVDVPMPNETVTTLRVRRASVTSISASSTSLTGSSRITLRGTVRKVQLITDNKAGLRRAPNTPVRLYFDPVGPRGAVYKKTVRTGSAGVYKTPVRTRVSGRWIAKYPGTRFQAPSERGVTITVK